MPQTHKVGKHKTTIGFDGQRYVRYRKTHIVRFDNQEIVLNTGGWKTVTTKRRMNQTSNQFNLGYQVYQKRFNWFVDFKGETFPFNGNVVRLERS